MKKHLFFLIASFLLPVLSATAGDILKFKPVNNVADLKPFARTILVGDYNEGGETRHAIMATGQEYYGFCYRYATPIELQSDGTILIDYDNFLEPKASSYGTQLIESEEDKGKPILFQLFYNGTRYVFTVYHTDPYNVFLHAFSRRVFGADTSSNPNLIIEQDDENYGWDLSFDPANEFAYDEANLTGKTANHIVLRNVQYYYYAPNRENYSYMRFGKTDDGILYFRGGSQPPLASENVIDSHITIYQEVCEHHASDLSITEGHAPTCTLVGQSKVVHCDACHHHFTDETCTEETSEWGVRTSPLGHDFVNGVCTRCQAEEESNVYNSIYAWYLSSIDFSNRTIVAIEGPDFTEIDGDYYYTYYALTNQPSDNGKGLKAIPLTYDASKRIVASNANVPFVSFDKEQNAFYVEESQLGVNGENLLLFDRDTEYPWSYDTPASVWRGYTSFDNYFYSPHIRFTLQEEYNYDYRYLSLRCEDGEYYFGLTDDKYDNTQLIFLQPTCRHEHKTLHDEDACEPTCTMDGYLPYYVCDDCGAWIDEDGAYIGDLRLPAFGHTFEDGACTICGRNALTYTLITNPNQITPNRKYLIVAKTSDEKSEQYYVMGHIDDGISPYGTAPAIPVTPEFDGSINGGNSKFTELDLMEVPRGSAYNLKQEPLYYFVVNGKSIRTYKGLDLSGLPLDPEQNIITQLIKNGYLNGLGEYEGDVDYIQNGALLTYINGNNWEGKTSFAAIDALEPYNAVIYPKGTFEHPDHCLGFVAGAKGERFFCTWYEANSNTQFPNVPVYLYGSTDDAPVVNYVEHLGTLYYEETTPVYPEAVYDYAVEVQSRSISDTPLTSIDLTHSTLSEDFSITELKNYFSSSKELNVSPNALYFLPSPNNGEPGKDEKKARRYIDDKDDNGDMDAYTNVIIDGYSEKIQLADAQELAIPADFRAGTFEFTKTLTKKWSTLVLPAEVSVPEGVEALEFASIDLENLTITFNAVSQLTPNVPVIIRKTAGTGETTFEAFGVEVKSTTGQISDISFRGTYTGLPERAAYSFGYHILAPDNMFHPAGESATIAPFRAFLDIKDYDGMYDGKDDGKDDDWDDDGKYDDYKKANLRIAFDENTGIASVPQGQLLQIVLGEGTATILGKSGSNVVVSDTSGRIIQRLRIDGEATTLSLPAGVYVINGTKVNIK